MSSSPDKTNFNSNNHHKDEGDAWGTGRTSSNHSVAKMPVERFGSEYNMNHRYRGLALIFNHETFDIPSLKVRTGTAADCDNLVDTLQNLDFKVQVFKDLRLFEIQQQVQAVAQMDHSENDCLAIAILSHGEMGFIYARDCQYKLDSIWTFLTANKCPSLAGKPKLFFIQACQGDQLDGGITLINNRTETDSGGSAMSYKIPVHADFLIAYSTIPDYHDVTKDMTKTDMPETEKRPRFRKFYQRLCCSFSSTSSPPQSLDFYNCDQIDAKPDVEEKVQIPDDKIHENPKECTCSVTSFYSWRNTTKGSWFIQSLCYELNQHGRKYDILTLLTFVCRRVAVDFESNTPDNPQMHQQKQIPCITTMLTRILKFGEK